MEIAAQGLPLPGTRDEAWHRGQSDRFRRTDCPLLSSAVSVPSKGMTSVVFLAVRPPCLIFLALPKILEAVFNHFLFYRNQLNEVLLFVNVLEKSR